MYSREPQGNKNAQLSSRAGEEKVQDTAGESREKKDVCLKCVATFLIGVSALTLGYLLTFTVIAYAIP